jgi:hypothetical protein
MCTIFFKKICKLKEIYLDLSSINEKKKNLLKEISLSFTSGKTLSFHLKKKRNKGKQYKVH